MKLLAKPPISGVNIVRSKHRSEYFATRHMEYATNTRHNEYMRDHVKRDDMELAVGLMLR